jgi:hypothetical protein
MVEREWRICVHEAGHATVARLLRLPRCGEATIIEPAGAYFSLDCGSASCMALMAGACAETVAFGDYDRTGVRTDRERWTQRLELLGHDETELWDRTLALVRHNLGLVEFLASMLSRAGTLDGGAIATTRCRRRMSAGISS